MNPSPIPSALPEGPASFALSAVSGFVDTSGFILLSGIFTSHVTGNLVLAGAAMAGRLEGGVWIRLALLVVFMAAVVIASALARWTEKKYQASVSALLGAESLMLVVFLFAGLLLGKNDRAFSEWDLFVIASTAVVAMGIQNALMREGLKSYLPTTMMTGNTTQFTLDIVALLRGKPAAEIHPRFRRTSIVLAGFILGAALGALAAAILRMWSPLIPALVVAVLAILALPGRPNLSNRLP